MKKIKIIFMLLAATPIIFLASCKKETANAGASTMRFNLTDAPANFDALNIDIQGVQVHTASGWVTLNSSLGVVNVLSYANGNSTLAAEGQVSAGNIDQVKLMLGSNNSVVVNGTTYPLQASGSLQTGLTTDLSGQLQAGGTYTMTIDFDAAQSVTASASGSGSFELNPVIRLIADGAGINGNASGSGSIGLKSLNISGGASGGGSLVINGSSTGNITGSISPAAMASVCVTGSKGGSVCTMTNLSGQFTLQSVGTGDYTVTITPMLPTVGVHNIPNVKVTGGATTNVGVVTM